LNALPFDPTTNSDPLHLNSSSGPLVTECPSLENSAENGKKRRRTSLLPDGNRNMTMPSNSMTMPMSDPTAWATAMSNLGMPPISMTGQQLMPGTTENVLHAAKQATQCQTKVHCIVK
ncbi:Ecto-NOX disulfide-thiol exchanger 2, partial [Larimichthys crocea]